LDLMLTLSFQYFAVNTEVIPHIIYDYLLPYAVQLFANHFLVLSCVI